MNEVGVGPGSRPEEPPGWLADPWGQSDFRWWNGFEWTDRTQAAEDREQSDVAETGPGEESDELGRWLILGGSILLVAGAFLPWAQVTAPLLGRLSVPGIAGDGILTAVAGGVILIVASPVVGGRPLSFGRSTNVLFVTMLAGFVVANTLKNVVEGISEIDGFGDATALALAQVGVGVWVTITAVVALFVGGLRALWDAA